MPAGKRTTKRKRTGPAEAQTAPSASLEEFQVLAIYKGRFYRVTGWEADRIRGIIEREQSQEE